MSESVTNDPIYSVLQQMRSDLSEMRFDVRDLKVRMTMVEEHPGSSLIAISGVNSRLDRVGDRVERIAHRLDFSEAR